MIELLRSRVDDICSKFASRIGVKRKPSTSPLTFLYECLIHDPSEPRNAQEFAEILQRGKTNAALYSLLRAIYTPSVESRSSIGLRLDLVPGELACVQVDVDPQHLDLDRCLTFKGRESRILDDELFLHPESFDWHQRDLDPEVRRIFPDPKSGLNHALTGLGLRNGKCLTAETKVATYGQIVDSCESLTKEAFFVAGMLGNELRDVTPESFLKCLPWRAHLHSAQPDLADLLLRPRNRAAGLGMSCATAVRGKDAESWHILRQQRSRGVGVHGEVFHVAPAGMMQFVPDLVDGPARLVQQKESLEELFNDHEPGEEDVDIQQTQGRFKAAFPPTCRVEMIGLSINLLDLRPEICCLAKIDDVDDSARLLKDLNPNWEGKVFPIPLDDGPLNQEPFQWVQSGAACWLMAEKRLRAS